MSITFDQPILVSSVEFWDDSAQTAAALGLNTFDIFKAGVAVGDAMVFGCGTSTIGNPWHNLSLVIDTPLNADMTFGWFSSCNTVFGDPSGWNPLTIKNDGTNGFTKTGSGVIEFDTPDYFVENLSRPGWLTYAIKCVVTAINSFTSAGKVVSNQPTGLDYTIVITGEENMTSIKAANDAGGWGVVEQDDNYFKINANFELKSTAVFTSLNEIIKIGDNVKARGFGVRSGSILQLGERTEAGGCINGSIIDYQSQQRAYPFNSVSGTVKFYDSTVIKRSVGPRDFALYGEIDWEDSIFYNATDMTFYSILGTIKNTYLKTPYRVSMNTGSLVLDNVSFRYKASQVWADIRNKPNATWSNIDFRITPKVVVYGYTEDNHLYLIDCQFTDFYSQLDPYHNGTIFVQYNFTLNIVDSDGSSLSGCAIEIFDGFGTVIFDDVYTGSILLTVYSVAEDQVSSPIRNVDYNPFTMIIKKEGYKDLSTSFDIVEKTDWLITMTFDEGQRVENFNGTALTALNFIGTIESEKLTGEVTWKS